MTVYQKNKEFVNWQNGQILLIVILVIITASTIGLSLALRSITSLRSASEVAESQKALAAAEAGVERAMQGSILPTGTQIINIPTNKSKSETKIAGVTEIDESNFLLNGGNAVPKNEGIDVWFVRHDSATGEPDYSTVISMTPPKNFLHLYWGSLAETCGTSTAPAAIQAIVVTRDTTVPNAIKTYRYAYDRCSGLGSRQEENNLVLADSGSYPKDYDKDGQTDITFVNRTPQGGSKDLANGVENIVFMRVIPLYKDTVIGLSSCNHGGGNCTVLPSQGYVVSSTGTSGLVSRKISVFKGYPQTHLPYISYGLFVAED